MGVLEKGESEKSRKILGEINNWKLPEFIKNHWYIHTGSSTIAYGINTKTPQTHHCKNAES